MSGSALKATQADGYYIPPSYIESGDYKKKSLSQHAGSKGSNQFQLNGVVRFEMPFKCVCTTCGAVVGKGTRFNARKAAAGSFYTSKLYTFAMKCYTCKSEMVLRNNPEKADYDFLKGIRRKVETWDTSEAGSRGVFDMNVKGELKATSSDAMGKVRSGRARGGESDRRCHRLVLRDSSPSAEIISGAFFAWLSLFSLSLSLSLSHTHTHTHAHARTAGEGQSHQGPAGQG